MKKLLLIIFLIAVGFAGIQANAQAPVPVIKSDSVKTVTATLKMDTAKSGEEENSRDLQLQRLMQIQKAMSAAGQNNTTTTLTTVVTCEPATGIHKAVGWILIASMILFFLIIAYRSNLLRVSIINPVAFITAAHRTVDYKNEHDINKIPKPFSLSRSQLGIWTLVIGCSYVYLELCKYVPTQELPFDNTLLALMGISAGTAAISNVIDNHTTIEKQGLQGPSAGFFADILSDQNGINIHRFQNVIWTVIAVVLYIGQVPHLTCGELPVLDNTLIALTGISSATYLGLKVNENKPPALPPPPATEADLPPANPVSPAPVAPVPPVIPVQPIVPPVPPVVPAQTVVVQIPPPPMPVQPVAPPPAPPVSKQPPAPPAV